MHEIRLSGDRMHLVRDMGVYGAPEPNWAHPERTMAENLLLYVTEGELSLGEGDTEYLLRKGDALLLKHGVRQWGRPVNAPGSSWVFVHFYDQSFTSAEGSSPLSFSLLPRDALFFSPDKYRAEVALPKKIELPGDLHVERELKAMLRLYQSRHSLRHLLLSLKFMELLIYFIHKSEAAAVPSKAELTARRVIGFLESRCDGKLTAGEIAEAMGMNYNYLSELFKQQTGSSILDHHLRLRIDRAAEQLRTGRLNISEVGERCGFSDVYHFSRMFKKMTGYTPTDYRNSHYPT